MADCTQNYRESVIKLTKKIGELEQVILINSILIAYLAWSIHAEFESSNACKISQYFTNIDWYHKINH